MVRKENKVIFGRLAPESYSNIAKKLITSNHDII